MKKHILFLILTTALICCSCAPPKFYNEIESTYQKEVNRSFLLNSSMKPHKIIFKTLKKELIDSNHIIYFYSPDSNWDSKVFSGAVYDVDNNMYYYFNNSESRPLELTISHTHSYSGDNYYNFVIDNFRNGKIGYLKKLGQISNHSGIRTEQAIFDVNLREGKSSNYTFRDFLFMNGKPTNDVN